MIAIDIAMLVVFSLLAVVAIVRTIGLLSDAAGEDFARRLVYQLGTTVALLLLTAFAALRVFDIGPGEVHAALGMLGAALLLAVHVMRTKSADAQRPSNDEAG